VPSSPAARTLEVRHLQLIRALLAAVAAIMITFSADHGAGYGLGVFSGYAVTLGLVLLLGAWVVYPKGSRAAVLTLAVLSLIAGMATGVPVYRSVTMFFVAVIAWALLTGLIEGISGLRGMRRAKAAGDRAARSDARDGLVVGGITVLLGLGLLLVPAQYDLNYFIAEAHRSFTLTGIAIAVGIFGGYAAVVAVYLGIAGLSPRRSTPAVDAAQVAAHPDSEESA
jgi:hypothetical protein